MANLSELTIRKFHRLLVNKEISVSELVAFYLKRIGKYDAKLNSVIYLNPLALKEAQAKDAQLAQTGLAGPLFGVPLLIKDNINTLDMPTTGGSQSLAGIVPTYDAFVVEKLRAAGAILLAKVNLSEFACTGETRGSLLGQTYNPYDLTYTPGGSSGGTGAGLAADFALAGLGTDTMNSIRSPASACSLVGLRTSRGLVSRSGVIPYALSHDSLGPLARSVEDTALVLEVLAGYDKKDPITALGLEQQKDYTSNLYARDLQGLRIGIVGSLLGKQAVHREVTDLMQEAFAALRQLGAELVEFAHPVDMDELQQQVNVQFHEQARDVSAYLETIKEVTGIKDFGELLASGKVDPWVASKMQKAAEQAGDTLEYQRRLCNISALRKEIIKQMDKQQLVVLVYPEQQQLVAKVGEQQADRNGLLAAATGFPALVVPCGFSKPTPTAKLGIPVGLELFGRPFSEALLLKIAYVYEQATKHRKAPCLEEKLRRKS